MSEKNIDFQCVVIAGMAKTGTTLPLTLLDNHPELTIFPEELRFFHLKCDVLDNIKASTCLLNDGNIQMLSKKKAYYNTDDYLKTGGTGFGQRNYSKFDYKIFEQEIKSGFAESSSPIEKFINIVESFNNAQGKNGSKPNSIFVCKAPHNELFISKWEKMLGENGKYIICTRLPSEHFLSLKNVQNLRSPKKQLNVYKYVYNVKHRVKLWEEFPEKQTFIIDYDHLVNNVELCMKKICAFLEILYHTNLTKPTKMGIPWAGNSSRNIVSEKVFQNKHKAHEILKKKEIIALEYGLRKFYRKMNWEITVVPNFRQKLNYQINYIFISSKLFFAGILKNIFCRK